MLSSASTSRATLPSSRSIRQQSIHSQMSDFTAEDEAADASTMSNTATGSATKRKANRSNPQVSYAYGAPSDGKKNVKKPRISKEINAEETASASPSPAKAKPADAATRYKAIKERQQRRHSTPLRAADTINGNIDSPRRSARLSTTGSQDGIPTQERQKAIAAIEEDQAIEEEEEEEKASSSASQQRRRRMMSPGQSRSANAHLSSFYLDLSRGTTNGNGSEGTNGLPTSLLRGAQRPRHDDYNQDLGSAGMTSIRSSDIGDSRSHDYAEEERYAEIYEQRRKEASSHDASLSKWSPRAWFKSRVDVKGGADGKDGDEVGETSLERKRRKARVSEDNQLYRPEEDVQSESDSGTSMEGRKHSHRKKKVEVKGTARGGRDDKKIWMNSGRRRGAKRRSLGGDDSANLEDGEEDQQQEMIEINKAGQQEAATDAAYDRPRPAKARTEAKKPGLDAGGLPIWAMILGALLLLVLLSNMFGRHDTSGYKTFSGLTASGSAPSSLSEASERILHLESAFGALKKSSDNAAKEEARLTSRLTSLENETSKISQEHTTSQSAMQSHIKNAEIESRRIQSEMGKLQTRLDKMQASSHAEETASSTALRKRLEFLEKQMKQTDKRLQEASEQAKSAEREAKATRQSLEWLEKKLPAQVAVPVHPTTGKPSLDAATWEELRKIFIGRQDIEFQRRNEEAIRTISLETVEDRVKTGAIIGRDSFVELLESELQKVKADMEDRFNTNAGEMQNEILAKIRAQQDMYEQSGSWKKSGRASTQDVSQINIPTKDGSDARQAIMDLIEGALEIYSADRIARRDFALYSAGARVIPSLTSPTYKLQSRSYFGLGSRKQESARPPVLALHHDTSPGMCWAFDGDDGQLGIGLARKVIVSDITLEHVASSISLEAGTSAPRDVTVWALVERREDRKRLAAHRQSLLQQSNEMNDDPTPAPAPPSQNHLLLASFTYDITSPRTIQNFPVSNEARLLQIPTSIIQVRVSSNYGNKDFTCLYRVRVHGKEWIDGD